jgi:hypothetical protein
MISPEVIWAAGFFDGEGTTVFQKGPGPNVHVQLAQAEDYPGLGCSSTLLRFQAAVGCGSIVVHGSKYDKPHWKPRWYWRVSNVRDSLTTLELLWPWLGEPKRYQARNAVLKWREVYSLIKPRGFIVGPHWIEDYTSPWDHVAAAVAMKPYGTPVESANVG